MSAVDREAAAYRSLRRFLWNRFNRCVLSGEQREFIWNLLANFPEAEPCGGLDSAETYQCWNCGVTATHGTPHACDVAR